MKIKALVPMKDLSERVSKKNYRPFGNHKPLFTHIVSTLLKCGKIQEIIINTDSEKIKNYCKCNFPSIQIIDRPENLTDGSIPMNEIIKHDLSLVDGEIFLQTHSTNPLVKSETFDKAINVFLNNFPKKDSLFSVNKYQTRLWDKNGKTINHNKNILLKTQDLEPLYEENSCIYIFERKSFLENNNRIGHKPIIFEMDKFESIDIDEEIDFYIAEKMYHFNLKNKR